MQAKECASLSGFHLFSVKAQNSFFFHTFVHFMNFESVLSIVLAEGFYIRKLFYQSNRTTLREKFSAKKENDNG